MFCALINKNRVLWQDVHELVSLVELCNALGFELQQYYTPLTIYREAPDCVMVQVIHESDAEDLEFSLKSLLRIIPLIESCQVIDQHEYSSVYKNNNGNPYNKAFLGTYCNCDVFYEYYSLNYFHGEKIKKIEELVRFFEEGEFEIHWKANTTNEESEYNPIFL